MRGLLTILLLCGLACGQDTLSVSATDTSIVKEKVPWPNPNKAALYSVMLPGLGQLYNKDYWKAPIIIGAAGTAAYFIIYNHNEFTRFRELSTDQNDELRLQYRTLRDYYRRNRDFTIMLTALGYALVAVEAYVDAHLHGFNVSDDLSLKVYPTALPNRAGMIPGLGLSLHIR